MGGSMDMAEEEHPEPAVTIEDLPTDTHDSLPGAADDEAGPAEPADQEQMQAESAEPTGATLPEPAVASECVKVAVRVRPLSAKEMAEGSSQCVSFPASGQIVIGKDRTFTFDSVFDPTVEQTAVYEATVTKLVDKVMAGFNATILAYGQTGSGKTHTMGSATVCNAADIDDSVGIIPRAVGRLFERAANMEESGEKVEVSVGFLEIYQEEVYDLLTGEIRDEGAKGLPIREEDGEIKVAGASEEAIPNCEGALECLQRGSLCRSTGETMMNSVSSRSHAIFTVSVKVTGERNTHSKLHFVDLAGSERAKRTGAEGARLKEGININQGLMTLGKVISALSDEKRSASQHVPYRESKLTRMLQDSLGGNSLTYMICCISPADTNFEETLNSLKYANRAKNIKNKPTVNEESHTEVERQLRAQVYALQQQLVAGGGGTTATTTCTIDSAEMEGVQREAERASRKNAQLEAKVASLMRENEELSANLLSATNDRDRYRSRLEEAGIQTTNNTDGEPTAGSNIVEEKNQEISALRKKVAALQVVADVAAQDQEYQKEAEQVVEINTQVKTEERELERADKKFKSQQDRLEYEIKNIDEKVAWKEKIMKELAAQASEHEKIKATYERNIHKLEENIAKNLKEKESRLSKHSKEKGSTVEADAIRRKYEEKIGLMRRNLTELKQKQKDANSALQMQRQQSAKLKLIEKDMENLKREKVDLVKKVKEEAVQHREWKQARELELRQLRRKQQKTQFELTKLENVREKQDIVLKRKHEEVAAAHRRVKEMERGARKTKLGKGRLLPAGGMTDDTVTTWLTNQVSECANETGLQSALKIEMMKRNAAVNKLAQPALDEEAAEALKEQLQFRNASIQNLQQQLGDRDLLTRFNNKVKRAADIEELRVVMSACIKQSVQWKYDNMKLERAATVAEERSAEMEQKLVMVEAAYEKECLERQQEYEQNMANLISSLAKRDEQDMLESQDNDDGTQSVAANSPSPAKESETERLRNMYKAMETAKKGCERDVKRVQNKLDRAEREVKQADKKVFELREENAELQMIKNRLEAELERHSSQDDVTPRDRRPLPVQDPRDHKSIGEMESLREELKRRSRTDSVVLARSTSSISASSSASSKAASTSADGSMVRSLSGSSEKSAPPITPRDSEEEESPKEVSPRESRRKPIRAWTSENDESTSENSGEQIGDTSSGEIVESDESGSDDTVWDKDGPMKDERKRIEKLTVPSLKDELKACDASRNGKKPELVARLLAATKVHWEAHGNILSTTTNIVRSASNDDEEVSDHGKAPSTKGQLYDHRMINKLAASFSPARGNVENEAPVDHSQKSRSKRQPLTMVRQSSAGSTDSKKTTRDTAGQNKSNGNKTGQRLECFGTTSLANATRAPDGRLIRSTSERDRVAAESTEKYANRLREKRALRERKPQRVSLLDNTDNYVKKRREMNGLPKEGIRGRQSLGGLSDESEYEPSDDDFVVEDM